jgi:hypothetical protein
MEEFGNLLQIISECEFKENKCSTNKFINYLALCFFSMNAGYITGQAVYFVFNGWFW